MPRLTQAELLQVYNAVNTLDIPTLQATACKLFSPRFDEEPPHIYLIKGGNRAFDHNGTCSRPKYTLGTPPVTQIGIMDNGTAYPY